MGLCFEILLVDPHKGLHISYYHCYYCCLHCWRSGPGPCAARQVLSHRSISVAFQFNSAIGETPSTQKISCKITLSLILVTV